MVGTPKASRSILTAPLSPGNGRRPSNWARLAFKQAQRSAAASSSRTAIAATTIPSQRNARLTFIMAVGSGNGVAAQPVTQLREERLASAPVCCHFVRGLKNPG